MWETEKRKGRIKVRQIHSSRLEKNKIRKTLKKRLEEEKGDVHQPSSSRFILWLNLSWWSFNNFLPYISCFQHFPVDLVPPYIQKSGRT